MSLEKVETWKIKRVYIQENEDIPTGLICKTQKQKQKIFPHLIFLLIDGGI